MTLTYALIIILFYFPIIKSILNFKFGLKCFAANLYKKISEHTFVEWFWRAAF